jgi:hypothetical protein
MAAFRSPLPIGRSALALFRLQDHHQQSDGVSMPTYIRIAYEEPQIALFSEDLSAVSIFVVIGLLQVVVAILSGGQWAEFGEQALWLQ